MDALKALSTNIPNWLKRLEELSAQIEQRQLELAKFAADQQKSPTPSLRNKGSTESLRPKDEPAAHPEDASTTQPPPTNHTPDPQAAAPAQPDPSIQEPPKQHISAAQQERNQVLVLMAAKARRNVRKRVRNDSATSAREGSSSTPKYRCKSMVLVYYDSYVQSFFEELVRFVSASRNLMRKAKMAAKVAQIKRMAEMEVPDDEEDEGINGDGELRADPNVGPRSSGLQAAQNGQEVGDKELTPLKYVSTRQMRMFGRTSTLGGFNGGGMSMLMGGPQEPDAFDALDKVLESVQAMCETSAHKFLRDGDCEEDIVKIKARLAETCDMADKEMERRLKEDPELANTQEPPRSRYYRLQSMRRESATPAKENKGGLHPPAPTTSCSGSSIGALSNGVNGVKDTNSINGAGDVAAVKQTTASVDGISPASHVNGVSAVSIKQSNSTIIKADTKLEADETAGGCRSLPKLGYPLEAVMQRTELR